MVNWLKIRLLYKAKSFSAIVIFCLISYHAYPESFFPVKEDSNQVKAVEDTNVVKTVEAEMLKKAVENIEKYRKGECGNYIYRWIRKTRKGCRS